MSGPTLPALDVHDVLVSLGGAVCVDFGAIAEDLVAKLERHGFDQAPVLDGGACVGVVPTRRLRELLDADEPLRPDDPELLTGRVAADEIEDVGDLLAALAEVRAVLVTGPAGAVVGMVTISDLNRHAVRRALYDLLSEVESRLATLLDVMMEGEDRILRLLGVREQIELLGHYHFMKRGGVELSILAGATLTQLLKVAKGADAVLSLLGYSKSKFEDETGSLPDLRNQVMHPVRPLVHSPEDVAKVLSRVERLADLRDRLHSALANLPGVPLL